MSNEKYDKKAFSRSQFYTLSAAVYSALEDIQAGEERFNQFLKWAIDGARMFNFDALHEVHVWELEMKPWKQVVWPDEMIDWSKIGVRCGDLVKVFVCDSSIPKIYDTVDCVPQPHKSCDIWDAECSDTQLKFFGHDLFGQLVTDEYAGYFDVDRRNRVFNFKKVVNNLSKIYIEGITDGINYNGQTVIHPYAFKALQDYIHWQRREHDDRYSMSEAQRAKELFEEELDNVLVRNLNLSIEDIKEALRYF